MGDHLERAGQLMEVRRHDLAVKELRAALEGDPDNAVTHVLLASCLGELKEFAQALEEAQTAIHLAPEYPYAHHVTGWIHQQLGNYLQAKRACLESLRLDPHHAGYHSQLAFIYLRSEQWTGARRAAEAGLEIDPEHIGCLNTFAWTLMVSGQKQQALEVMQRALRIDPNSEVTHGNLGRMLLAMDRHDLAVESLQESLRLNPTDEDDSNLLRQTLEAQVIARVLIAPGVPLVAGMFWALAAREQAYGVWVVLAFTLMTTPILLPFILFVKTTAVPRLSWLRNLFRLRNVSLTPTLLSWSYAELGISGVTLLAGYGLEPVPEAMPYVLVGLTVLLTGRLALVRRRGLRLVAALHVVAASGVGVAGVLFFLASFRQPGLLARVEHRFGLVLLGEYLLGTLLIRMADASAAAFDRGP